MRKPADWMTAADERILEVLFEVGEDRLSVIRHRMENHGIDYHHEYVGQRCRELAARGLLNEGETQGQYSITGLGRGFVAGEVNLQEVDPNRGGDSIDYQWSDSTGTTDSGQNAADVGLWPSADVEYECAVCGRSITGPHIRLSIDTSHPETHTEWYIGENCRHFFTSALGDD